jgi:hypothetical protein
VVLPELPELALPEVELPEAGFVEVEFPEVALPELGLGLAEVLEFALLVLELLVFELLELALLELELLVLEFPEFAALAFGVTLAEPLAPALVLPELALVFPELVLGAGFVEGGASGTALPSVPAMGPLAAVMGGVVAVPYALLDAAVVGFCARAWALPKATKTVTSTTIRDFVFISNYSCSRAFSIGGVHLPVRRRGSGNNTLLRYPLRSAILRRRRISLQMRKNETPERPADGEKGQRIRQLSPVKPVPDLRSQDGNTSAQSLHLLVVALGISRLHRRRHAAINLITNRATIVLLRRRIVVDDSRRHQPHRQNADSGHPQILLQCRGFFRQRWLAAGRFKHVAGHADNPDNGYNQKREKQRGKHGYRKVLASIIAPNPGCTRPI